VDINARDREVGNRFPTEFILEPQDELLSAEHLAYAYHAVAQRFLFVFARHARPLFGVTIALVAIPAVVATLHVLSDLVDLIAYEFASGLTLRFVLGLVLLIVVWRVTIAIIGYVIDSSILLNGWYLASKHVWTKEWDESTDGPASKVKVNTEQQTATAMGQPA
jgi:hypothetical protein